MINQHVAYYLGSKAIAAVLNLGTMALFVRVGGVETYGGYVVSLAWAAIVYGLTLQWLRFSFFGVYREEKGAELIATYLRLLLAGLAVLVLGGLGLVWLGRVSGAAAVATLALTVGLAIYDALHEMSRTRLKARAVAIGVLTRASMMLVLGWVAIVTVGTSWALATAVAAAHLIAAVPMVASVKDMLGGGWSRDAAGSLYGYGRGLIPAYGLDGVGLQLDRLLLARFGSLGVVGSYGAVSDLIRQLMVVVSEAISGAYMAIARAEIVAGREAEAVRVLGQAFLAYVALTAFGSAGILRFDRLFVDAIFGREIGEAVEPALPLIVAASAVMVFRSYYFGQVLYLTDKPELLVRSNAAHCLVMVVVGLALAPLLGMTGVAAALLLGHAAGCAVYILAWRGTFALRLPLGKGLVVVGLAVAAYAVTGVVEVTLPSRVAGLFINLTVFAVSAVIAARLFNILSFNDLVGEVRRSIRARRAAGRS